MTRNNADKFSIRKFSYGGLLLTALLLTAFTVALSADDRKVETIDATAMGTSTQLGKVVNVKVTIYDKCGHRPEIEKSAEFIKLVREFLA